MCGIWALFGTPNCSEHLGHALKIAARGPDCFHVQTLVDIQNCCMAFHWLKVVDDMFGMQPMRIRPFPHLYLMCDGRIYNHELLGKQFMFNYSTSSDAEVILHLYNAYGIKRTAQLLDGAFSFCIIDTKRREIHLARDLFGIRPLYTLSASEKTAGILAICSEIKGLVPVQASLNRDNLNTKIKFFLPGNYASYSLAVNGRTWLLDHEPFTHVGKPPDFETQLQFNGSDVMQTIQELFFEAVRKRMMGDRRIGCYLSGGIDSSLVSAVVTKLAKEKNFTYPIQTFSIGMEGSSDIDAARKVAAHIGSDHHEVTLTLEEGIEALRQTIYTLESYDPLLIQSAVFHNLLAKYIAEKTDTVVLLAGEGADPLFQGFTYYLRAPSPEEADEHSRQSLASMNLCSGARADRCNSAHGLEYRAPFQDVHLTSYVLSIPPHMRQPKNGCEKWLLRACFDKTNLLPEDVLWRSKLMFNEGASPGCSGQSWYDILKTQLETQISDETMAQAKAMFSFNTPKTKEEMYYRQIFEEFFPDCAHLVPSLWTPKW